MTQCKLVHAWTREEFDKKIEELLKAGWGLYGQETTRSFSQLMTREVK